MTFWNYVGIHEEMKVFNNKFYVEPSPDIQEPSRKKKCQTFIRNPLYTLSGVAMLGCQCSNWFLMTLFSIDDITYYTEKNG